MQLHVRTGEGEGDLIRSEGGVMMWAEIGVMHSDGGGRAPTGECRRPLEAEKRQGNRFSVHSLWREHSPANILISAN